jgi:hypothetical protein
VYDFFGIKPRNFAWAHQKQPLTHHPTKPCHSLSTLEIREILVKVPKKDRKHVAFGKREKKYFQKFISFCLLVGGGGEHT